MFRKARSSSSLSSIFFINCQQNPEERTRENLWERYGSELFMGRSSENFVVYMHISESMTSIVRRPPVSNVITRRRENTRVDFSTT